MNIFREAQRRVVTKKALQDMTDDRKEVMQQFNEWVLICS